MWSDVNPKSSWRVAWLIPSITVVFLVALSSLVVIGFARTRESVEGTKQAADKGLKDSPPARSL